MVWPAHTSAEEMARLRPAYGTPGTCSAKLVRRFLRRLVHRQQQRHSRLGQTICRQTEGQSAKTPRAISYLRSFGTIDRCEYRQRLTVRQQNHARKNKSNSTLRKFPSVSG